MLLREMGPESRPVWGPVLALVALLGIWSGWSAPGVDATQPATSSYEGAPCPFVLPGGLVEGDGIACGFLTAPRDHGGGGNESVRLAIARIPSTAAEPAPEPLVLLLGGPGQGVETVLPAFAPGSAVSYRSLLKRQDVILLEQRGIGYSEPSLACRFDAVGGATGAAEIGPTIDEIVAAFDVCAGDLRAAGTDLEAFDSIQSAADVDALRAALGYERVDLLGISYGSRLALTVMRDFPDAVRAAVLASPLPLQANVVAGQIVGFDAALDRIFAACSAEAVCAGRYQDLNGSLSTAIETLDESPLAVQGVHPITGEPVELTVDGGAFLEIVYVATFIGPLVPFVPALIDGVVGGNNVVLETLAPYTLVLTTGVSLGANYVVNCNEEYGLTDADEVAAIVASAGVRPELAGGSFAGSYETFDICDGFGLAPAGAGEDAAVASDLPVLILAGEFDPITPPAYAVEAAATLPNSVVVVFDGVSHDPISTSGSCGFRIVAQFLSDPGVAPDAGCAATLPFEFVIVSAD